MEQWSLPIYTFSEVLEYLKKGYKASRNAWYLGDYIYYDDDMKTICKKTNNSNSPWETPQMDLLAQDWLVIESV